MIAVLLLMAAPLPFAKPAPPPVVPGAVYLLTWQERDEEGDGLCPGGDVSTIYTAVFQPSGRFEAWGGDGCFAGRWRVEGGVLKVRESLVALEDDCLSGRRPWQWKWSPEAPHLGDKNVTVWLERVP